MNTISDQCSTAGLLRGQYFSIHNGFWYSALLLFIFTSLSFLSIAGLFCDFKGGKSDFSNSLTKQLKQLSEFAQEIEMVHFV